MESINFFIHGNGLNSELAPLGMRSVDMPGHNPSNWNSSNYSMEKLTDFYVDLVPKNSVVWAHSLGGHIAINLASHRPDLKIICFGMVPLNSVSEIGSLMTPYQELSPFQNPNRTEEDVKGFLKYSSLGDDLLLDKLYECSKNQDPNFNSILFSSGIENYEWNEQEKAEKLKDRFLLILSPNEALYNFEMAKELNLNILIDNYHGHCPWLIDTQWVARISKLGNF
jgi:pimeloyl-ACP methyl ester carboxylesterase